MKVIFLACFTWFFLGWNSAYALIFGNTHEKCYEYYGCFPTKWPYTFATFRRAPWSPEKLKVKLLLSKQNTEETVIIKDLLLENGVNQNLDLNKPIKIIAPGFLSGDGTAEWTKKLRDVLLRREDCNVMVISWKEPLLSIPLLHRYHLAMANTRMLGAVVGEFLYRLNKKEWKYNYNLDMVHIYGHSLGAHVAGYIGKYCKKKIGKAAIGTITGLDPAGPGFELKPPVARLDATDAKFVLALHTDAGPKLTIYFGIIRKVGHVDVFVNNGKRQPGCMLLSREQTIQDKDLFPENFFSNLAGNLTSCSHMRATEYAIEWLDRTDCKWVAYWCTSKDKDVGYCMHEYNVTLGLHYHVRGGSIPMTDKYYIDTNSEYPYCQGSTLKVRHIHRKRIY